MMQAQSLPTIFAIAIAESIGILDELGKADSMREYNKQQNRLRAFQQMAIGCELEDTMIAYYGQDLSEEQIAGLAIIYKSTVPWLIGHVVGGLMEKGDGKSAELILTELLKDGKVNPDVARELIVKLQVVEPIKNGGVKK